MKISVLDVARVVHEANRALCLSLGDTSQVPFDEAPSDQIASATAGVEAIVDGHVRSPEASHESWSAQKVADGWVYGPVKDLEKREHPCLVPYGQLPVEQQRKDFMFLAIVTALAPIVGA